MAKKKAKKKAKKRQSKAAQRRAELARARRARGQLSDLAEFARFLEFQGRPSKGQWVFFNVDDYREYSQRTQGETTPEALLRRFERWKARLKKIDPNLVRFFEVRSRPEEASEDWELFPGMTMVMEKSAGLRAYVIDRARVDGLLTEADERVKFFIRASGREVPESRAVEAEYVRDKPIKDVLRDLEIPYASGKVKRWIGLGMPAVSKKRGTRTFYYGDTAEIFDWVHAAIKSKQIADPFAKKLPVHEARPRVQAALARLPEGLSKTQIASLLGVTRYQLETYWREDNELKFIPRDVVAGLERLAKEGLPEEMRLHAPRKGTPSLAEVKAAIAEADQNLNEAERILRERGFTSGVTASNLGNVARRYKIPLRSRRVVEPTKKELKQALEDHRYRLEPTAEFFGFSVAPLNRLIDKHGLRPLVDRFGHGKISKADVEEAAEVSGFVTAAAAEALEIHPAYYRDLLRKFGILEWFDQEAEAAAKKRRATEQAKWRARIKVAIERGMTREKLADQWGVPLTTLESRVRALGLKRTYGKMPYTKRFAGEREREVAPEETGRVPFWMAALRDLRARYPGRGGGRKLAKALGYGNATISNWLNGKRVPGMPQIERIMEVAGQPMPDWRAHLHGLIQAEGSKAAAARALGVRGVGNIVSGRVLPSEKLLERILGEEFWVSARVLPETGHRKGLAMGEPPPDTAKTHLAQAMARLLTTVRSQRELARQLEVSTASISRFMRGIVAAPPPEVRDRIVALYVERFGEPPAGIQSQRGGMEALQEARKHFPTQRALAEELGLTRGHLSRILGGHTTVSPRIHARVEQLLRDLEGPQSNPPRFQVRSPAQGLRTIRHPDITRNYEKALRWRPKHKKAVLVPCAQTKPFPDAPSHRAGYLKALKGKKADVWVVSEPLGVVPYAWSRDYPNYDYDFPPQHLRGRAHDVLAGRVTSWLKRVGPKYQQITLALPAHHMRLVDKALDMLGYEPTKLVYAGIGDCLDAGACPPGHYRATSQAYRKYLRRRANPPEELGDCYEAALNYMMDEAISGGGAENLRLIHATVTGQGPIAGVPHGHAWVEEFYIPELPPGARIPPSMSPEDFGAWFAIDRSSGRDVKIPAALYRFMGQARDIRSYTYPEVRRLASRFKHYGPWE
jgi:transcriptional regulator with XRE-family HTH domain